MPRKVGKRCCAGRVALAQARSSQTKLSKDISMLRFPRSTAAFAVLLTVAACNASDKAATSATTIPDVEIPELPLPTPQDGTKELPYDAFEGPAPGQTRTGRSRGNSGDGSV